jgi:hypothetical protein
MIKKTIIASMIMITLILGISNVNAAPEGVTADGLSPSDGSSSIAKTPTLYATINLISGPEYECNIYFMWNNNGVWEEVDSFLAENLFENTTYSTVASFATELETSYEWSVNASSSIGWTNESATFTTLSYAEELAKMIENFIPVLLFVGIMTSLIALVVSSVKFN